MVPYVVGGVVVVTVMHVLLFVCVWCEGDGDADVGSGERCGCGECRCRLVRLTPYACSPAIDGSVLTVVVRECIVVFG